MNNNWCVSRTLRTLPKNQQACYNNLGPSNLNSTNSYKNFLDFLRGGKISTKVMANVFAFGVQDEKCHYLFDCSYCSFRL